MTSLIDVHHHVLPPPYTSELAAAGIEALPGYGFPDWSPSRSLEVMDENGIELAVLSVSAPGLSFGEAAQTRRLARECNEYLAELVSVEARFGAFGCLPLPDVEDSIAEAELVLEQLGFHGVVIYTNSGGIYPGDPRLAPLMSYLSDRRAIVFVHPVQPCGQVEAPLLIRPSILEFVFETTRAATSLIAGRCLSRYPDIRWILTHGGGTLPYLAERLGHLRRDKAVEHNDSLDVEADLHSFYFDVASCSQSHALRCLADVAGEDRVLFGSDFPFETGDSAADAVARLRAIPEVATGRLAGLWRANAADLFDTVDGPVFEVSKGASRPYI